MGFTRFFSKFSSWKIKDTKNITSPLTSVDETEDPHRCNLLEKKININVLSPFKNSTIKVYVDGSHSKNKNLGSWSLIVIDPCNKNQRLIEISKIFGYQYKNDPYDINTFELWGIIGAYDLLHKKCKKLLIYSDSDVAVNLIKSKNKLHEQYKHAEEIVFQIKKDLKNKVEINSVPRNINSHLSLCDKRARSLSSPGKKRCVNLMKSGEIGSQYILHNQDIVLGV